METHSIGDFESAGRAVLSLLHRRLGFDLWMVTRTEGDDWIVLQSEDHGYGVEPGTVFRWADSFCSEMVKGNGPRIAPRSAEVPAYAAAPIGRQVQIGSYVGLPLVRTDGSLFGTLCAIHPLPQPESIVEEQDLVELLGAMLSKILQAELNAAEEVRRYEKLQVEVLTDEQTGLYNRRGWDRLLASEEERCRRYGHPAAVLMVDLDQLKVVNDRQGHAAGDALIVRAGATLRNVARKNDIVARLGGDEFGILIAECDCVNAEALLKRIRTAFAEADVKASMGLAMRDPAIGLEGACLAADKLMYEEKSSR
ncbi:MAG: sensor domain-containing diguanylate cyclase [Verrucomicrobia bacterium]|nr:sensor domain-containing diguanylate cyclase [Verrucomicrobiota bacterium]